jgi:hypothetical protein
VLPSNFTLLSRYYLNKFSFNHLYSPFSLPKVGQETQSGIFNAVLSSRYIDCTTLCSLIISIL